MEKSFSLVRNDKMKYLNRIDKIQFELSNLCNALCLGCVRTDDTNFNNVKHTIPKKRIILTKNTYLNILQDDYVKNAKILEFCGTIDEPTIHPHFLELMEISLEYFNKKIFIHTNGSTKNKNFWANLANILKKFPEHRVQFSIDGLQDTNSIYRQNTNFEKIIENATIFIENGGNAIWQFLIFNWNKHQIQEAKELSKKIGFKNFITRHDRSYLQKYQNKLDIYNIKTENKSYMDSKLSTTHLKNDFNNIIQSYKEKQKQPILCNNRKHYMFFISYDSRLWPCCFIPNNLLAKNYSKRKFLYNKIFKNYKLDFNDLTKKTFSEIVNHSFYQHDLVASWNNNVGLNRLDKIHRCVDVCSKKNIEKLPIGGY